VRVAKPSFPGGPGAEPTGLPLFAGLREVGRVTATMAGGTQCLQVRWMVVLRVVVAMVNVQPARRAPAHLAPRFHGLCGLAPTVPVVRYLGPPLHVLGHAGAIAERPLPQPGRILRPAIDRPQLQPFPAGLAVLDRGRRSWHRHLIFLPDCIIPAHHQILPVSPCRRTRSRFAPLRREPHQPS